MRLWTIPFPFLGFSLFWFYKGPKTLKLDLCHILCLTIHQSPLVRRRSPPTLVLPFRPLRIHGSYLLGLGAPAVVTSALSSPGETKLVQLVLLGHLDTCSINWDFQATAFVTCPRYSQLPLKNVKCLLYQILTSRTLGQPLLRLHGRFLLGETHLWPPWNERRGRVEWALFSQSAVGVHSFNEYWLSGSWVVLSTVKITVTKRQKFLTLWTFCF